MNNRTKIGSMTWTSILLSILIALSGMAAIALADDLITPNRFSGTVMLNGAPAPNETVINAFIDGDPSGSIVVESPGEYEYLSVDGSASDDGKNVTFTVCGANAEQNGTWTAWVEHVQILNLTAEDHVAPAVENANANPASIVNGTDQTRLNVTVIDGCQCTVGDVTVNLSAIGGDAAQEMERIGDTDVYSVTTNATEGTALGAYCLPVNASDVFGNYNTSVCIALEIVETVLIGDINGDCKVDYRDLGILGATYGLSLGDSGYNAAADLNGDNTVNYRDLGMLGAHYGEVC